MRILRLSEFVEANLGENLVLAVLQAGILCAEPQKLFRPSGSLQNQKCTGCCGQRKDNLEEKMKYELNLDFATVISWKVLPDKNASVERV